MAHGQHRAAGPPVRRRRLPVVLGLNGALALAVTAALLAVLAHEERLLRAATALALVATGVTAWTAHADGSRGDHADGDGDGAGVRRELAALREALGLLAVRVESLAAVLPPPAAVAAPPGLSLEPAVPAPISTELLLPLVRAALLETALASNGNGNGNGNGAHRVVRLPAEAELPGVG